MSSDKFKTVDTDATAQLKAQNYSAVFEAIKRAEADSAFFKLVYDRLQKDAGDYLNSDKAGQTKVLNTLKGIEDPLPIVDSKLDNVTPPTQQTSQPESVIQEPILAPATVQKEPDTGQKDNEARGDTTKPGAMTAQQTRGDNAAEQAPVDQQQSSIISPASDGTISLPKKSTIKTQHRSYRQNATQILPH